MFTTIERPTMTTAPKLLAAGTVLALLFGALLGSAPASAAEANLAPVATVKGTTIVSVNFDAYNAVTTPEEYAASYEITVYEGETETIAKIQTVYFAVATLVTGLAANTAYSFEVKEAATAVSSGRSTVVTTLATAEAPGTPEQPTATTQSSSTILVSWPALSAGVEVRTYTVKTYLDSVLKVTKTAINPLTAGTSWLAPSLLAYTAYTFTVTAIGYDGTGLESAQSEAVFTSRGVSAAPTGLSLVRTDSKKTDVTATWAAPTVTGGYPITGYRLQFYNTGGSTASAGLLRVVDVPATATTFLYENTMVVGGTISFIVNAVNAAGTSASSTHSTNMTLAATASPAPTVTLNTIVPSAATATGFTLSWTASSIATAATGYVVRVVEHLPSNGAASTNYTYRIIDLGSTDWALTGTLSTVITGLEGSRTYRASITAYTLSDGVALYGASTGRSATAISTTGSSTPAKPVAKAATPVVLGIDSLSWAGAAITDAKSLGGSAITGYRIEVFESGSTTAESSVDVVASGTDTPATVFTGLTRDTFYSVRYAGINENGVGAFSDLSDGVSTLLKPLPGTVLPHSLSLSALLTDIKNESVTELDAAALNLDHIIESNSALAFTTPWAGAALDGEAWLYRDDADAAYLAAFAISANSAAVSVQLGELPTGTYYLALYPNADNAADLPLAVKLRVTKPITGLTNLDDAVFRWGINNESNNGAFYGGCNFLVAGKVPDIGAPGLLSEGRYTASDGNVSIVKPNLDGVYSQANWGNKCLTRSGQTVTSNVTSAFTDSQVMITGGTGTVDPSTNSANIHWSGDFTVVYYGGLTFWYASNPTLSIVNGVGTVTATASGFGTDMYDEAKWVALTPRTITLATISGVQMNSTGLTALTAYLGVGVESETPQPDQTDVNRAFWGSFPQDFVDFQKETGQLSYWYTSNGLQDRAKIALPIHIGYDVATFEDPDSGNNTDPGQELDAPTALTPPSVPVQRALRPGLATSDATTIADTATLLQLIEDGTIARITAEDAGIPATFAIGDALHFDLAWPGADTTGSIWWYPAAANTMASAALTLNATQAATTGAVPQFLGSFTAEGGRVKVSLDSTGFTSEGVTHFSFFGEDGTTVAVSAVAERAAAPLTTTQELAQTAPAQAAPATAARGSESTSALLITLIIGLAVILVLGTGGAIRVLRRKAPAAQ